ncbi:hypothetical protein PSTG_10005 [Puccinia striiformis f. sp. tritici PST-78]|uniref:Uncharacterized protein n=1 Tax=Puccinia striiformis f. sp. tritici PST-78 TaxID=1165861 RepID=A0A0L0VCL7_9BASI|nr:hypothetical protein PSTG_10005 [Puccinia striiformis f. sp. tritici PST-78]
MLTDTRQVPSNCLEAQEMNQFKSAFCAMLSAEEVSQAPQHQAGCEYQMEFDVVWDGRKTNRMDPLKRFSQRPSRGPPTVLQDHPPSLHTGGHSDITQVVVFINQVTSHLSSALSDKVNGYPPLCVTPVVGLQLTNKYYTLTDCSLMYQVAMGIASPVFQRRYSKLVKWEPEWIKKAL